MPLFQHRATCPTRTDSYPHPKTEKKSNIFYACRSLSEGLKTKLSFFEGTFQKKKSKQLV